MTATTKHIPGKRLKTWHRRQDVNGLPSVGVPVAQLKLFARAILETGTPEQRDTVIRWAGGKVAP